MNQKIENKSKPAIIEFTKNGINYNFTSFYQQVDGRYSVYIPAYDMIFSAKDMDSVNRKSIRIVKSFYDFHLRNENHNHNWKTFILAIHKLGFKAPNHDFTVKNLLNNKPVKTKFKAPSNSIPDFFDSNLTKSLDLVEEFAC